MEQFAYAGGFVPGLGDSGYGNVKSPWESRWDGGDPGLNYRFWDRENGYKGSEIDSADDDEIESEEAAFLDGLFACRRQCKKDKGGYPSLRTCIRACKGKGPKKSALKGMEAEANLKMADALAKMSQPDAPDQQEQAAKSSGSSKTMIWIIVGIVAVIGIAVLIYFLTRKKAVPVVA